MGMKAMPLPAVYMEARLEGGPWDGVQEVPTPQPLELAMAGPVEWYATSESGVVLHRIRCHIYKRVGINHYRYVGLEEE